MSASIYDISQEELKVLAEKAIAAKDRAYCPYSNFRVGAALLLSTGAHHTGANVEVAATPVGICAERCALAPCVAAFTRPDMPVVRALAVSTDISPPASPCGMCRQMMREFCGVEMKVFMFGRMGDGVEGDVARGEYEVRTMGELLPMSFGPGDLKKRGNEAGGEK